MKKIILLIFAAVLVFVLLTASCGKGEPVQPSYTSTHTMGTALTTGRANDSDDYTGSVSAASSGSSGGTVGKPSGGSSGPSASQGSASPADTPENTTSKYKKSGTVYFSDSADNAYIAAVVSAYGEDASFLAAVYTVPHGNDNTVLCFDGTLNPDGTPLRNADTLRYIYTVDSAYNIKRASESAGDNIGYGAAESRVMFYSVRRYLIPEYESELG